MKGVFVHRLGVRGVWSRVILVSRECIRNALVVLLGLQTFDNTGSLSHPLRRVVYRSLVSTLMTAFRFLARNREADLKRTTFSSLLLFHVFLSFLLSYPPSYITLSAACWGYSIIYMINLFSCKK